MRLRGTSLLLSSILAGCLGCQARSETWSVRIPEETVANRGAAEDVRRSLFRRADSLQDAGSPRVLYQGAGEFTVELSATRRSPEVVERALSDPGGFWIRTVETGHEATCDDTTASLLGPDAVEQSRVGFDREQRPVLNVQLTRQAGDRLRAWTTDHVGSDVALCLGDRLLHAPTVRAAIGSAVQIGGLESAEEAAALAAILSGGAIPPGATAVRSEDG